MSDDAHTLLLNQVSWGAIFAGVVVALVVQVLLTMLGVGIGVATLDPGSGDNPAASTFSVVTGLWYVVSGILAAFAGGYIAARMSGKASATTGALHGLTTWAFTTLIVLYLTPAVVLGHSWGASVAMALALRHPASVKALVPVSGYYYPTPRVDAVASSGPAIPILGDILRYTVAPLLGRALWPTVMRKIFGPAKMPAKFANGFPKELALRPSQLRASAAESALMVPEAWSASDGYGALRMPVVIVAGARDRLIDTAKQSARLHEDVGHSSFHAVAGAGHMVHQTATRAVMAAIDEAAAAKGKATELAAAE